MGWVVDTCILIDVLEDDPDFGVASATLLERLIPEGLEVCPVTYVELAPAFGGDRALEDEFLQGVGIELPAEWTWADTLAANAAWARFIELKRQGAAPRRPIADILIGAYAANRRGLVTRNPDDFARAFPELSLVLPG